MMKRNWMHRLGAFAAAAALVLSLAGCGAEQSGGPADVEPVQLTVWTYYNGDQLESFNRLVEEFNATVGKEQNITITSSTNMSKEDIDKAVREAEQFAAEDKARKDEVDTHNAADQVVYQTEKALEELGDKISADEKSSIQSAVDHLKEVNKGTDVAAIKSATEAVQQAFYKVSEKMYQQANPQGGQPGANPGCDPNCQGDCGNGGDNGQQYYDADYKVVDDDENKK